MEGPASKEKVDDGIYALEHAHGSIMSALEVEISRGSYLGEILTNCISLGVCRRLCNGRCRGTTYIQRQDYVS